MNKETNQTPIVQEFQKFRKDFDDYLLKKGFEERAFGERMDKMEESLENYVHKHEFTPVRNAVYGAITAICFAFLAWLTALVWPK